MQKYTSSAQASEALRMCSLQADHAATVTFDYVKVKRDLQNLIADLRRGEPVPTDEIKQLEEMYSHVTHEHSVWRDYAESKQSRCIQLNEQIQNGVYEDEAR